MSDIPITDSTSSSQRNSRGQIVERDRSPRNRYEVNLATQTQNNQFVDESRNAQLNQQFVDARRLQFNVGVDPMIHQESIDALRQEAVERHHQILQDELRVAHQQHQGVLRDGGILQKLGIMRLLGIKCSMLRIGIMRFLLKPRVKRGEVLMSKFNN